MLLNILMKRSWNGGGKKERTSKIIQGTQNMMIAKICGNRKIFQHNLLELMKVIFCGLFLSSLLVWFLFFFLFSEVFI